jgi:hypothetical protein
MAAISTLVCQQQLYPKQTTRTLSFRYLYVLHLLDKKLYAR